MEKKEIQKALNAINQNSKKRNFEQKIELIVTFKGLDPKKPEGQIDVSTELPRPFGKGDVKTLLFAKTNSFALQAKPFFQKIVMADEIPKLRKKDLNEILSFDALFAEGDSIVLVGRHLGQELAPKGKMPKPIQADLTSVKNTLSGLKGKTRLTNKKGKAINQVQLAIARESMPEEQVIENILHAYKEIEKALPKKKQNIKNVYLKKTMGPVEKISF